MKYACVCLVALLSICGAANADPFTMNSSLGVWASIVPPGSATGVGTSQIRWGTPAGGSGQSGYDYDAAAPPPVALNTEVLFLVGTFVHHNQPVTGDSITGATLDITLDMTFGSTSVIETFAYNFQHVETPNSIPCQFGPADGATNTVPCDDRVSILNSIPDQTFTVGGTTYTLDLIGFSQDGGATVSNKFFTTEEQNNYAGLYAEVTSNFTPTVPEPSSVVLLITVIGAGLACTRKRWRRA